MEPSRAQRLGLTEDLSPGHDRIHLEQDAHQMSQVGSARRYEAGIYTAERYFLALARIEAARQN
jgi:hypothetical protein